MGGLLKLRPPEYNMRNDISPVSTGYTTSNGNMRNEGYETYHSPGGRD